MGFVGQKSALCKVRFFGLNYTGIDPQTERGKFQRKRGRHGGLAFGGGGQFGLWLDEAFEYGSSGRSSTFGNEPLTTAAKPRLGDDDSTAAEFRVMRAEFWGFEAASPRGYATEMEIPDTEYDEDDVHARGMGGATPGVRSAASDSCRAARSDKDVVGCFATPRRVWNLPSPESSESSTLR